MKKRATLKAVEPKTSIKDLLDTFVSKCKSIDESSDMELILQRRILTLFEKASQSYIASTSFFSILNDLHEKIIRNPSDVYVYISYLREELQKAKKQVEPPPKRRKIEGASTENEYSEYQNERDRKNAKKLSKALEKLHRNIKTLEQEEVEWDSSEESDSAYIQLQRYKERAAQVFEKLCTLTNESKAAGRIKKLHFAGTPFPGVNKCIEQYVNKTGEFPDYIDILDLVKQANHDEHLNLRPEKIEKIAKAAFQEVGKELQTLRKHADAESILMLVEDDVGDPADKDEELRKKLDGNKQHWSKINKIIDEFAEKEKEKKSGKGEDENEDEDDDEEDDDDAEDDDNEESEKKAGSSLSDFENSTGSGSEEGGDLISGEEDSNKDNSKGETLPEDSSTDFLPNFEEPNPIVPPENSSVVIDDTDAEDISDKEPHKEDSSVKVNGILPVIDSPNKCQKSEDELENVNAVNGESHENFKDDNIEKAAICNEPDMEDSLICTNEKDSDDRKTPKTNVNSNSQNSDDIIILDSSDDDLSLPVQINIESKKTKGTTKVRSCPIKGEIIDDDERRSTIWVKSGRSMGSFF